MDGSRRASIVLPAPGGPMSKTRMAAGGRDLERALGARLSDDVREIRVVRSHAARARRGRRSGQRCRSATRRPVSDNDVR